MICFFIKFIFIPISYDGRSTAGNKLMQCKLFFPCFKDSSSCLPHFMLAFPWSFLLLCSGSMCRSWNVASIWTNLATTQSIDLLWQTSKFYTSKFHVQNFHFPNVSKTRRLQSLPYSILCAPFWSIWRLWNVASIKQPSCKCIKQLVTSCLFVFPTFSPYVVPTPELSIWEEVSWVTGKPD
jgi:hypothetical protein